ncbi:MAG: XRE family transcriptional regulator [Christensenellales bacterium]
MMTDFITIINNVLEELGKSKEELFDSGVISKDTFYKYKKRNPSLATLIRIANYLHVSIDYIYELTDNNDFIPYSIDQSGFYQNLQGLLISAGISGRKFCKDLHYAKDNLLRYKNGVMPSITTLIEISQYFNCTIDDLLTRIS